MNLIFDITFQCQPICGLGSQTHYISCEDSDRNMSDKCGEEKPTSKRQCRVACFDNLEEKGGSNKLVTVVDGQYDSVYNHHGASEIIQAGNLTDFAEFLEISNSCLHHEGWPFLSHPSVKCPILFTTH